MSSFFKLVHKQFDNAESCKPDAGEIEATSKAYSKVPAELTSADPKLGIRICNE